jgi:hypothetical protein
VSAYARRQQVIEWWSSARFAAAPSFKEPELCLKPTLAPYTNRYGAQGYTKYKPLPVRQKLLVDLSDLLEDESTIRAFAHTNDELIRYLAMHPEIMHELEPRQFEELIAELFSRMGYVVELTNRTRDGGKDICALKKRSICQFFVFDQMQALQIIAGSRRRGSASALWSN